MLVQVSLCKWEHGVPGVPGGDGEGEVEEDCAHGKTIIGWWQGVCLTKRSWVIKEEPQEKKNMQIRLVQWFGK